MNLDFAVLADAATVDSSGKLNILGIFDRIAVAEFPARHDHMCLVVRFSAGSAPQDGGDHEVEILVLDPAGDELARMSGSIELGPVFGREQVKIPQVVHMDGFVFPVPGEYTVEVNVDGEVVRSLPLHVSRANRIPQA